MLKKIALLSTTIAAVVTFSHGAIARDQIRAVGSSTVYPFITVAAEEFGKNTSFKTPIVESTGTGGGFKLFCGGAGEKFPDIANASRAIKPSEVDECKKNKVTDLLELKIGYDGIVLANSVKAEHYKLSREHIFKALARKVPVNGKLVANPYKNWSDIDASLPNAAIEVYGPPPTSGTRDAFVELVMDHSCVDLPEFKAAYKDEEARKKACGTMREDGKYIEVGENDNLIVQKLSANPKALGIFGFSFLDQNSETVQGSHVDGMQPTFENIIDHKYTISRPLFIYVKTQDIGQVPGLKEFITEVTSDKALGDEGYMTFKGLIPLPAADRDAVRAKLPK